MFLIPFVGLVIAARFKVKSKIINCIMKLKTNVWRIFWQCKIFPEFSDKFPHPMIGGNSARRHRRAQTLTTSPAENYFIKTT